MTVHVVDASSEDPDEPSESGDDSLESTPNVQHHDPAGSKSAVRRSKPIARDGIHLEKTCSRPKLKLALVCRVVNQLEVECLPKSTLICH
jgi:hypothetical protein